MINSTKKKTVWTDLCNCFYVVSHPYSDIAYLESPVFEVFDDLDTSIIMGLREESLSFFVTEGWIDEAMKEELSRFRDHLERIENRYWNPEDFDRWEDWVSARNWAKALVSKLGLKNDGWDSTGTKFYYTEG